MTTELFRKTTDKGAVLVVSLDEGNLVATVDGKPVDATLRRLGVPKTIAGKTVVAQIGPIGLTREECEALSAAMSPPPAPVPEKYRHAESYSAEAQAFDRGFERRTTGE